MTDENAKKLWCPMVRFHDNGPNRNSKDFDYSESDCNCLGSGCACWVYDAINDNGRCGLIR